MTARLIMDPNPVRISPSDTIGIAARKIMRRRYRSLPVVDDENRFLGVVTVNCMLRLLLPRVATMKSGVDDISYADASLDDLRARLKKHMDDPVTICIREKVATVTPDTSLLQTLRTLYTEKSNLPVVDKKSGRLEGMISYYDVGEKIMEGGFRTA